MDPSLLLALLVAAWIAGCAAPGASDRQSGDGPPARPFVARLTADADPGPPSTRENLTQWNWTRQIATDEAGGVHVVWAQLGTTDIDLPADRPDPVDTTRLPPGQIRYLRSADGGHTWSDPNALTPRAIGVDSGAVATAGRRVYVIWRQIDGGRLRVFFRSSTDGGQSWGDPIPISDNPPGVSVSAPAIAVDP